MKEFKGTKGEWRINKYFNVVDSMGYGIAQPHGINNDKDWLNNAKLIAAAPDLLEALQEAYSYLLSSQPEWMEAEEMLIYQIEKAINKALS